MAQSNSNMNFLGVQQTKRHFELRHRMDGYGFEGEDLMFIEFHLPLEFDGLFKRQTMVKKSNFLKSRPDLEGWKSILVPLWTCLQDPPEVYVCWRGEPLAEAKQKAKGGVAKKNQSLETLQTLYENKSTSSKPAQKAYASIVGIVTEVLEDSIKNLGPGKTKSHFLMNSEENNARRIYTPEDYKKIAKNFNATTLMEKFKTIENHFFQRSEVVFLAYELGINQDLEPGNVIGDIFPFIMLPKCSHAVLHLAWDWTVTDGIIDTNCHRAQSFLNPKQILKNLQKSSRSNKISNQMLFDLCFTSPNKDLAIGNLQCSLQNSTKICFLNFYKKNGVNSIKKNAQMQFGRDGMIGYLDENVLKKLWMVNMGRDNKWKINEKPAAVKGVQRSLVEFTTEENQLVDTVRMMEKIWKCNAPIRMEFAVRLPTKDAKPDDPLQECIKEVQAWITENNLDLRKPSDADPIIVNVSNSKVSLESGMATLQQVTDDLFAIYHEHVMRLIDNSYKISKNANLLELPGLRVTSFESSDIANCVAVESLMYRFFCGKFPPNETGNRMQSFISGNARANQDQPSADAVSLDPGIMELIKCIKEKPTETGNQICTQLLSKDHWSFKSSAKRFFELRSCWREVRSKIQKCSEKDLPEILREIMRGLLRFALMAEWHKENENDATLDPACPKEYFDKILGELSRAKQTFIVRYHSIDWMLNTLAHGVSVLPNRCTVWIYKFLEMDFQNAYPLAIGTTIWKDAFKSFMEQTCLEHAFPFLVGETNLVWCHDDLTNDLIFEEEPPVDTSEPQSNSKKKTNKQNRVISQDKYERGIIVIIPTLDHKFNPKETFNSGVVEIIFKSISFGVCSESVNDNVKKLNEMFGNLLESFVKKNADIFKGGRKLCVSLQILRLAYMHQIATLSGREEPQRESKFSNLFQIIENLLKTSSTVEETGNAESSYLLTLRKDFEEFLFENILTK